MFYVHDCEYDQSVEHVLWECLAYDTYKLEIILFHIYTHVLNNKFIQKSSYTQKD